MSSPNSHIEDFLNYYCALEYPPEYAVMLKGKWGCGKTWFIKNYCERLKQDKKYLYVSLYGIKTYGEIENLFFQQLHPVLSSKGMALAGQILKGALKATVKVDLDGDNKLDGSLNSQVPDIKFPEYLRNTDGNILIFDDLERCCIKNQDILGYINHFIEHQGFKVIIIANEDDIISKDESESSYVKIKEKLVGKTFEITSDIDEGLNNFIKLLKKDETEKFIKSKKNIIKETYLASGYQNLRLLKQSLWDFERLYSALPEDIISNDEFCENFLQQFLAFSFEIKSGSILPTELKKFTSGYLDGILRNENEEKSKYMRLTEKYSNITFYDQIFELSSWELFFDKGIIDTETILESLKKNKYFQDDNTANWVKLWHFTDLEDDKFDELYNKVSEELSNKEHEECGVVQHITGMFLKFSELDLIKETKKKIIGNAKAYVDYLKLNNLLGQSDSDISTPLDGDSWGSLGFIGTDISEFKELNEYIAKKTEESKMESMPEAGKLLLETMASDTKKFYTQLVNTSSEDSLYYETPILKYISPDDFVAAFDTLSPENKRMIGYALTKRYKDAYFREKIYEEIEWLRSVRQILSEKQQILHRKVSGFTIKKTIDSIDKSIKILRNSKTG